MKILLAVLAGLLLSYAVLLAALLVARPRGSLLVATLRLLPDLLRLVRRLAADPAVPRAVRVLALAPARLPGAARRHRA